MTIHHVADTFTDVCKSENKMTILDLSSLLDWTVTNGSSIRVPGKLPGQIHTDLLTAGIISDPYDRYNYIAYRWIANESWIYSATFSCASLGVSADRFVLVFEGLDTIAEVSINDRVILRCINQFVRHIVNVSDYLRPEDNELRVAFSSAVAYAHKESRRYPYAVPDGFAEEQHGERHRNFIRKEQCSFSWDWGPCFATCGIWKPIRLVALRHSVWIHDLLVWVTRKENQFVVSVKANLISDDDSSDDWMLVSTIRASIAGLASKELHIWYIIRYSWYSTVELKLITLALFLKK